MIAVIAAHPQPSIGTPVGNTAEPAAARPTRISRVGRSAMVTAPTPGIPTDCARARRYSSSISSATAPATHGTGAPSASRHAASSRSPMRSATESITAPNGLARPVVSATTPSSPSSTPPRRISGTLSAGQPGKATAAHAPASARTPAADSTSGGTCATGPAASIRISRSHPRTMRDGCIPPCSDDQPASSASSPGDPSDVMPPACQCGHGREWVVR